MERITASQVSEYLRKHDVINKQQHGFLLRRSTTTNLLETLNDWTIALKVRQSVAVAYIDFQRRSTSSAILNCSRSCPRMVSVDVCWSGSRTFFPAELKVHVWVRLVPIYGQLPAESYRAAVWDRFCSYFMLMTSLLFWNRAA